MGSPIRLVPRSGEDGEGGKRLEEEGVLRSEKSEPPERRLDPGLAGRFESRLVLELIGTGA